MSVAIRIRSKQGVDNIKQLDTSISLKQFQDLLKEKTGIDNVNQKILYGYPPKPLDLGNQDLIISTFITNGESLTIEEVKSASTTTPTTATTTNTTTKPTESNVNTTTTAQPVQHQHESNKTNNQVAAPEGYIVRRLTENDNSCLFSSVAYVLENKNRGKASQLRNLIASTVKKDPFTFNEGFLGKDNADYCRWILEPKHWGGAIELSILSQHYKVEIGAFDIATKMLYCYGEDQNYKERVYVIYDGIHYDALSLCLVKDGPEDFDVTIFDSKDQVTLNKAKEFVEKENKAGKYTDTANFELICLQCNKILRGEKEAALHAAQTKHGKFQQTNV